MTTIRPIRVFVDSDVIISSLISNLGASYALLNTIQQTECYVSNFSIKELEEVVARLKLDRDMLDKVIDTKLITVEINQTYKKVKAEYADYVQDPDDAHIVAGAKEAKATFLLSYNVRHFNAEKLRQDFQIVLLTPGLFLQYLRSLSP